MRVLLFNICLRPKMDYIFFPVGLAYIATAIKRSGYDLEFVDIDAHRLSDEELENILKTRQFDVAAFGCIVTGYKYAKKLAALVRRVNKSAVIVAGNSVADSIPEILLSKTEVDIGVVGEGDVTIVELLDALKDSRPLDTVKGICFKKNDKVVFTPRREAVKDLDSIPFPDWDLFDVETYIKKGNLGAFEPYPIPKEQIRVFCVNTARGCLFRCGFCYQVFQQDKYRSRSAENVLEEIKILQDRYDINYILFNDELTFFSKEQAEKFVDKILEMNMKFYWVVNTRANLFTEDDVALLKKIRRAGGIGFVYSLESADPEILRSMNKFIKAEDFIAQTKALQKAGITVWTSIVLGYPQETPETLKHTFDVCYDLNVYPSVGYLLPQPKTQVYELAKKNMFITNEEEYLLKIGDRQDFLVNFTKMPDDFFQAQVRMHLKRISDKLNLGLSEDCLIKTGHYKADKA